MWFGKIFVKIERVQNENAPLVGGAFMAGAAGSPGQWLQQPVPVGSTPIASTFLAYQRAFFAGRSLFVTGNSFLDSTPGGKHFNVIGSKKMRRINGIGDA